MTGIVALGAIVSGALFATGRRTVSRIEGAADMPVG
jgi:hypothetical protein